MFANSSLHSLATRHRVLITLCSQATNSRQQIIRVFRYLYDAQFFDRYTKSVTFEVATFNSVLGVFGSWRLHLSRGSSGVFQGVHVFDDVTSVTFSGAEGTWRRAVSNVALLAMCAFNLALMLRDSMPATRALLSVRLCGSVNLQHNVCTSVAICTHPHAARPAHCVYSIHLLLLRMLSSA